MEEKDEITDYMNKIKKIYSKSDKENFDSWVLRVTTNDSDVPHPRIVRRIINSIVRDSKVSALKMIDVVENESEMMDDSRAVSKLFYLILLATQYRNFTVEFETLVQRVSFVSNNLEKSVSSAEEKEFQLTSNALLQTLISKQAFHFKHPEVHGNFYRDTEIVPSPTLVTDLITHLEIVTSVASTYIARFPTQYRSILTMFQPIVEELVNVYELIVHSSSDAKENPAVARAEEIIEQCRNIDIIKSSVIFPHPTVVAPRMRYPFMK